MTLLHSDTEACDLKPCCGRSRRRIGRRLFPARLFSRTFLARRPSEVPFALLVLQRTPALGVADTALPFGRAGKEGLGDYAPKVGGV